MTPSELQSFIEQQTRIGDRIARKAARVKQQLLADPVFKAPRYIKVLDRAIKAIDKPGLPPSSRPKGIDGAESFHFRLENVTKASLYSAAAGAGSLAADRFLAYMEREGAAETVERGEAQHVRGADAQERASTWFLMGGGDRDGPGRDIGEAARFAGYIERPEAPEVEGDTVSSFGNIAERFEDRLAFWRALDDSEPAPKNHKLRLWPARTAAFWQAVDADPDAPLPLRRRDRAKDSTVVVSDAEAAAIHRYVRKHATGKEPPAEILEGRARRIQTKLTLDLPHELSPAARLKLARKFCDALFEIEDLGRRGPGGKPDPRYRVPYHAVIHAPDRHNDARNFHLHVAFSEKPATRMIHPETGKECWDFEVETIETDRHRNTRTKRPFEKSRNRDLNARTWAGNARKLYARLANEALAAASLPKRYDPRRYVDMGIEAPARARLPKAVVAQLKKGRAGLVPEVNAKTIAEAWRAYEAALIRRHPPANYPKTVDRRWRDEIARWRGDLGFVVLSQQQHAWRCAVTVGRTAANLLALDRLIYDRIRSQIDPPLAPGDKDAKAFLAAYDAKFMAPYRESIRYEAREAKIALRYLERAQTSDPSRHAPAAFAHITAETAPKFGVLDLPRPTYGSLYANRPAHVRKRHEDHTARVNARFFSYVELFYPVPADITPKELADAQARFAGVAANPPPAPEPTGPAPLQGAAVSAALRAAPPVVAPSPAVVAPSPTPRAAPSPDVAAPKPAVVAPAIQPRPPLTVPLVRPAVQTEAEETMARLRRAAAPALKRAAAAREREEAARALERTPGATGAAVPKTDVEAAQTDAAPKKPPPPEPAVAPPPKPPRKKKRILTEAEVRRRALIAQRNRGRGR